MKANILIFTLLIILLGNSNAQNDSIKVKFLKSDNFSKTVQSYITYPSIAIDIGIQGEVILSFRVAKNGCIDSIIAIESPDKLLTDATMSALNKVSCDWEPAKINGVPVINWLVFRTTFSLNKGRYIGNSRRQFKTIEEASMKPLEVKFLILQDSTFTNIPREVFSFRNLFNLDLSNNKIRFIPSDIMNCKNLNFLLLRGNQIEGLPHEIVNLKKLYKIDLSHNNLNNVPGELFNIKGLNQLDLSYNNLTSIPSEIGILKKLRFINLAHNDLDKLPEEFLEMNKIFQVDLQGNNFSDTEKEIIKTRLPKAKILF